MAVSPPELIEPDVEGEGCVVQDVLHVVRAVEGDRRIPYVVLVEVYLIEDADVEAPRRGRSVHGAVLRGDVGDRVDVLLVEIDVCEVAEGDGVHPARRLDCLPDLSCDSVKVSHVPALFVFVRIRPDRFRKQARTALYEAEVM